MNIKKESELKSLQYLEEYLTYEKLQKVYERNLKLATQIEEKVLQCMSPVTLSDFQRHSKPKDLADQKRTRLLKCTKPLLPMLLSLDN